MSYFLGIFGGQGPNPAAALVRNGELLCFCEEERFSRIKGAPSVLPIQSIFYCLSLANISLDEIKEIGFGWDCERLRKRAKVTHPAAARAPRAGQRNGRRVAWRGGARRASTNGSLPPTAECPRDAATRWHWRCSFSAFGWSEAWSNHAGTRPP